MAKPPHSGSTTLPQKADILRFLEEATGKITKREIARAFRVKGADRVLLKGMLQEMEAEGLIERDSAKSFKPAGRLPSVTIVEVSGIDAFGDVLLRPVNWTSDKPPPPIRLGGGKHGRVSVPAPGRGDRALARLEADSDGAGYIASIIKLLEGGARRVLGVFHGGMEGGRVVPVDKKAREELLIDEADVGPGRDGELVLAELLSRRHDRPMGLKPARVIEGYGDVSSPKMVSLIAIHQYGLPTDFSENCIREAENAKPVGAKGREDLRGLPLITIDPEDARDHDDAVFAEPDPDPNNPGGFRIIVAIADVAHYVRPGSALDREARERGNSAYFPDRVVPMLPEALSNDLCSLKPGVDRAAFAVHIRVNRDGEKIGHRFARILMRSHANIAYEAVQAAFDGAPSADCAPLMDDVIRPLYAAHDALTRARAKREPLAIETEEKKIHLNEAGEVAAIVPRQSLRAHQLIEDMMIAANVCAAETLEERGVPCMYRVHEEPALDRIESLREFLQSLDYRLARAQRPTPRLFNGVLTRFKDTPHAALINQVVLRSQSQAAYSPDNRGHFGLALQRYAHFTSPIRRYADLVVHRGLIRALGFGPDGLTDGECETIGETAEHISMTERRAMAAERDSVDRYLASFLAGRVGQTFEGRISGVTRFGLFVTLLPSGGDGLAPVSSMGSDFYVYEEHRHALIGQRHGRVYRLGDQIKVRLAEATPVSGGLKLEIIGEPLPQPHGLKGGPHRGGKRPAGKGPVKKHGKKPGAQPRPR